MQVGRLDGRLHGLENKMDVRLSSMESGIHQLLVNRCKKTKSSSRRKFNGEPEEMNGSSEV